MARERVRELPRPVFALSPDGAQALAVCMKRLEHASPGWGILVSKASRKAATVDKHPLHDGLWLTDVATGKGRLLVSLRQLHEVVTTGALSAVICAAAGVKGLPRQGRRNIAGGRHS